MSKRVSWVNPFVADVYMLTEGTELPDGNKSEDGGTLVIEHDGTDMLCMDSPLDVRDFLQDALNQVNNFIKQNGIEE